MAMAIQASYGARSDTLIIQIAHMIGETDANIWSNAKSILALVRTLGYTILSVMFVAFVTLTATLHYAEKCI